MLLNWIAFGLSLASFVLSLNAVRISKKTHRKMKKARKPDNPYNPANTL